MKYAVVNTGCQFIRSIIGHREGESEMMINVESLSNGIREEFQNFEIN